MSAYKGRNAFLDTSSPYAPLPHGTGVSQQRAGLSPAESLKRAKPIRDAIDIHRSAEDTLQNAGFCSPGLDAMREANSKTTTSDEVAIRLKELETRHHEEIQKLFDLATGDYFSRVMDAYQSVDGGIDLPELDRFLETQVKSGTLTAGAIAEYHDYRYVYLRTRNRLLTQANELRAREEKERKHREAQFPHSISQYQSLEDPSAKDRVARFLVADQAAKERMLTQFGWAWRQVQPLVTDFSLNVFNAEINTRVRTLEAEATRDPRRKQ